MALDVSVNIDAKDIEASVVRAIADSAFGARLKEAVELALKQLGNSYSYDDQLKKWVEQKMRDMVVDYVEKNYTQEIEAKIKAWLSSAKLQEITDRVISTVVQNLTTKGY